MLQAIGRRTIESADHLLDLFAFTNRIVAIPFRLQKAGRKVVLKFISEQIYFTAIQALPLALFIALITGSLIVIQLTGEFATVEGKYMVGKLIVILVVREVGPLFTALIVILRSAVAVTVETSYMAVLGEFDCLEMQGIDPVRVICLPRLIGISMAVFCLFFMFDLAAIFGGYAVAWTVTEASLDTFFEDVGKAVSGVDITVGLVKAIFFGLIISVTSLYRGFSAKKAITEVPQETSRAAVECLLYSLFMNIVISIIFYI